MELNKKFKGENKDFDKIVQEMKIKKKKYSNSLVSIYNNLNEDFMATIYNVSARIKARSRLYSKILGYVKKHKII